MAACYGRPPSSWVLTPAALASAEGQSFAYDFDQTVFLLGRTLDAEQGELRRRSEELKRRSF
jgi:hypothetical protein